MNAREMSLDAELAEVARQRDAALAELQRVKVLCVRYKYALEYIESAKTFGEAIHIALAALKLTP